MPHAHASGFPPPCCNRGSRPVYTVGRGPVPRHATLARDRPSRYGERSGPLYRRAGACPPPCRDREKTDRRLPPHTRLSSAMQRSRGTGPRATVKKRLLTPVGQDRLILTRSGAGAPELQRGAPVREGQALALRYSGAPTLARDRPSRYGWTEGSRGTGPRATVNKVGPLCGDREKTDRYSVR